MDQQAQPQPAANNIKQTVVERVRQATTVLVTVSRDPSVDQLAAAIGLTLMLNKLGKHATAVFSGKIPSTIEFLKPEETLEATTDSLRDFIIALDKAKADKLRYKVEGELVKIYITPYRTKISEKDLEFSQGEFNVEVVIALGVKERLDLDEAIIAHGKILHDATVISLIAGEGASDLGSINWDEPTASSLCEMLVSVSEAFQSGLIDPQMATAFLTGIVSATERFSNTRTTPKVMTMSAQLMAAGANQQLIATQLKPPAAPQPAPPEQSQPSPQPEAPKPPAPDGSLTVEHKDKAQEDEDKTDQINIDDEGNLQSKDEPPLDSTEPKIISNHHSTVDAPTPAEQGSLDSNGPKAADGILVKPPTFGSSFNAADGNTDSFNLDTFAPKQTGSLLPNKPAKPAPLKDELTLPSMPPMNPVESEKPAEPAPAAPASLDPVVPPAPVDAVRPNPEPSLPEPAPAPEATAAPSIDTDAARKAVESALSSSPSQPMSANIDDMAAKTELPVDHKPSNSTPALDFSMHHPDEPASTDNGPAPAENHGLLMDSMTPPAMNGNAEDQRPHPVSTDNGNVDPLGEAPIGQSSFGDAKTSGSEQPAPDTQTNNKDDSGTPPPVPPPITHFPPGVGTM